MEWTTILCVDLSLFNQSYTGDITKKKSIPYIGGTTIQLSATMCLAAMGFAMEPGVHAMSNELITVTPNFVQYSK